ncbi:alanyl-tRNA editing protein [Fictibacillus phosphorivorans]|uniref:alanyl-tRNA editing protein n=1 Tax=Fictibacillus phosphorivorans TaxID=1221500 RepID=UPI002040887E|nr:alanine--tRNA ligase-related protein [Fictibacillus phosphorivorans]MCM3719359.1 alanine--tRNA ligase-related protein [Fictibacillus phosphorivorans]MCM3776980.1 alanine--tRNA ligase-related protein [Fictibacillus phosphorivorans]
MTNKLYYSSPYTTEWETRIKKAYTKENQCFVVLDETAFYPTGGGQPHDTGTINGIEVVDVFIDEDGEVVHRLKKLPDTTNATCSLNWERRFEHMQHHSGQHLLSAVCYTLYNAKTISFHLGEEHVTIDLATSELNEEQLEKIELAANEEIYRNRPIHTYFVTSEELAKLPLLKMPKVTENIRIVEIEDIEYNACGGTHVLRTGEIGMIKLMKTEKQRGDIRLFFKCGLRALQDINESQNILHKLAGKFNTGRNELLTRIEKWEKDKQMMETKLAKVKDENHAYVAKELLGKKEGDLLHHVFEDKPFDEVKQIATMIANEHNVLCLFASASENKAIIIHDGTKRIPCRKFLKEHIVPFNGKGGGNEKSAQAGFPAIEDTLNFMETSYKKLLKR